MPVTLNGLSGKGLFGNSKQQKAFTAFTFTTHKDKDSRLACFGKHFVAWRHGGPDGPELVFTSPINDKVWVTQVERDSLIREAIELKWAYKCRKGHSLVSPFGGRIAWLPVKGLNGRHPHKFWGYGWNRVRLTKMEIE